MRQEVHGVPGGFVVLVPTKINYVSSTITSIDVPVFVLYHTRYQVGTFSCQRNSSGKRESVSYE